MGTEKEQGQSQGQGEAGQAPDHPHRHTAAAPVPESEILPNSLNSPKSSNSSLADIDPECDPVCGMTVKPESPYHSEFSGTRHRFCSARCKTKFDADPGRYLTPPAPDAAVAESAPAGAEYTCPMHPEIRQIGPGSCPKCGIAMSIKVATGQAATQGILYPAYGLVLSPLIAALAMSFSSASVVGNALRLRRQGKV